jgi:hypothetical protein
VTRLKMCYASCLCVAMTINRSYGSGGSTNCLLIKSIRCPPHFAPIDLQSCNLVDVVVGFQKFQFISTEERRRRRRKNECAID